MKKIDKVLKELSELYEFNREVKAYEFTKEAGKSLKKAAALTHQPPRPATEQRHGRTASPGLSVRI